MTFYRRNKILVLLFVICIYLIVKNSSVPYLFNPPALIKYIFDRPKSILWVGIAQIIDIFTSAYVTSLTFYYLIDFVPSIKQENKAEKIIEPELVNLYSYINELLAMIEFAAKKSGLWQIDNIKNLDNLFIGDKEIECNRVDLKNEKEIGRAAFSFNLLKDCNKFKKLIVDTCRNIASTSSFIFCNKQIINIISSLQLCDLIKIIPDPNDPVYQILEKQQEKSEITILGLSEGYQQLMNISKQLELHVGDRIACRLEDISQEEISNWKNDQIKIFKEHPEIIEWLIKIQNQDN